MPVIGYRSRIGLSTGVKFSSQRLIRSGLGHRNSEAYLITIWVTGYDRQGIQVQGNRPRDRCQLTQVLTIMAGGKRKQKTTLTKIDISSLKLKPPAVSQHADADGIRVTATVDPSRDPPEDPDDFDADLARHTEAYLEDDDIGDDISRGFYVARVCGFYS